MSACACPSKKVARHLIDNPGAILQLNMGEGKTRVIMPMLILHWADGANLVRLHILTPLLHEAFTFLHQTLSAGVLGRKLFAMPFDRDVELTLPRIGAMRATLERCQRSGGVLLVAREHRLSLQLRQQELASKQPELSAALERLIRGFKYVDVFDESDEVLRHKYQLIYAVGSPIGLPDGDKRWGAIQALLRVVKHDLGVGGAISKILNAGTADSDISRVQITEASPGGGRADSLPKMRLLPGPKLEACEPALTRAIAQALMEDPPHDLEWLKGSGRSVTQSPQQMRQFHDDVLNAMCDPAEDDEALLRGTALLVGMCNRGLL